MDPKYTHIITISIYLNSMTCTCPKNSPIRRSHASSRSNLDMKYTLVLVRHGESTWNLDNRFTGWYDCPLSENGEREAHEGGVLLREGGFDFDVAYTSTLKRAIKTLWIVLEEMDLMYIPIVSADCNDYYNSIQLALYLVCHVLMECTQSFFSCLSLCSRSTLGD